MMKKHNKNASTLDDPNNHRRHPVPGLDGVKYATEASNGAHYCLKGRFPTSRKLNTINKLSTRKELRVATWNVRGLLQPGKLTIVENEADKHLISVLGLSETHMRGQGHFTSVQGSTLYFSGSENKSANGVGILLPAHINKHVLGYVPVSDRNIALKLDAKPNSLNIIQVYAPTEKASEEDIDNFYGALETTLKEIPNREITIILGDWNAKVGNTYDDDHIRSAVGKFGLGNRSERGQRLIEFCVEKSLCITNTCFQHHPRRLYTWTSPGARYRNQIDYIIVNSRWRSSIRNIKTYPGAECGSDHNLLVANFALRLKAPRKCNSTKLRALEPSEREYLSDQVEAKLAENPTPSGGANDCWEHMKSIIGNAIDDIVNRRKNKSSIMKRQSKAWISEYTWSIIERRKAIKTKGLQNPAFRKEHSDLSKLIKKLCRRDKHHFLEDICADIECNSQKYQTADLFKKVRLLSKKFTPKTWVIEDSDGTPIHELKGIVERWREYCEELYDHPNSSLNHPHLWNNVEREPSILRSEVTAAIRALKPNKAPGIDLITAEIYKTLGDKGIDILLSICNHVWYHGDWPKDWTESVVLPLHKKGSTRRCDNYRTLALISHGSKIFLQILNTRIRHYLDWQIPQEQAGFVKGKGTREQILNIRQLIEKSYEFDTPVVLCFIDYSKAFDCVDWNCLWTVLSNLGVPQHLINLLQSLYYKNVGLVKIDHEFSRPFRFKKGVRQGCILSPILFNIYGEYIIRRTCENWEGGVTIGGTKITNLRYADDTTLFAANEAEMVALFHRMEHISRELGLSINRAKTKVMVVDRTGKLELTGELNLQMVTEFTYLGSTITNTGTCDPDIRRRIGMAKNAMSQLHRMWTDRNISNRTKQKLVTTLVFSIFLYGAETWTLKKADRSRIDAFEMWCWRRMLRIPWTARRTNISILEELKVSTRLSTICIRRILNFFGHIARKSGDNLEKLMVIGKMEGKRPRGRSPMRWTDQIRSTLDSTVAEAVRTAEDRKIWRKIVHEKLLRRGHDPQQ